MHQVKNDLTQTSAYISMILNVTSFLGLRVEYSRKPYTKLHFPQIAWSNFWFSGFISVWVVQCVLKIKPRPLNRILKILIYRYIPADDLQKTKLGTPPPPKSKRNRSLFKVFSLVRSVSQ